MACGLQPQGQKLEWSYRLASWRQAKRKRRPRTFRKSEFYFTAKLYRKSFLIRQNSMPFYRSNMPNRRICLRSQGHAGKFIDGNFSYQDDVFLLSIIILMLSSCATGRNPTPRTLKNLSEEYKPDKNFFGSHLQDPRIRRTYEHHEWAYRRDDPSKRSKSPA